MNTEKRRKYLILALLLATLAIAGFIFYNGAQDSAYSNARSDSIIDKIKPLLDPHDRIDRKTFNFAVRKTAHITEYGVLGVCLGFLSCTCTKKTGQQYYSLPLLLALLSAVLDEYIQSFTTRTSLVSDVLFDFAGSAIGISIVLLIFNIRKSRSATQ